MTGANIRKMSKQELGQFFECSHISYNPKEKIVENCKKALEYQIAGVYCNPYEVPIVKPMIEGSGLFLGMSLAFPRGIDLPDVKAYNAQKIQELGVTNIDFVINYRAVKEGNWDIVEEEVEKVRNAVPEAVLKMIVECCELDDEQLTKAVQIGIKNKVNYIKSSTGQLRGPSFHQVDMLAKLLKNTDTLLKVSGVQTPKSQNAFIYLLAGAKRIGSQNPFEMLDGIDELREAGIF
ncbi:MAG: deoxyribose-phosphate aldolase [Lachnospiraceae bacterium]|nr:deoxyribose-phosphate aldolase [Lachnospiraceae bacterium]